MDVRVLGPLEMTSSGGAALRVRGARRRLLAATLVLHRNALCATEHLVDVLFGEDPPVRAAGTAQSYVSRLRDDLGDDAWRLRTRPGGYTLAVDDDEIDSARFNRRVSDAARTLPNDPAATAEQLAEGLKWWSADRAFTEFTADPALQAESTRLDELRRHAVEVLIDAHLALGDHAAAIDQLETCIGDWPLHERFRAQQMLALHRSGRHPDALRAFRRYRTSLGEELGLEPSTSLTELEALILRQDPSLDRLGAIRRPRSPTSRPDAEEPALGNLPLRMNALLGRDSEITRLEELLGTVRLLTLVGAGGVGKTRLALRLAERAADAFPDGVWVCDLAAIREDALVTEAITTTLDVQRRGDSSTLDGLIEVLQSKTLLVIFDNCEHLLDPVTEITETIGRTCPEVCIVATSREPLGVDGEKVWPVGPLALPEPGEADPIMAMESAAVRLFVARATAADPGFRLTETTSEAVSEICHRLDGLPLALELAAARSRAMAPGDLAARLDERFTILHASSRSDPRHRTLHATVAWSYDLLGLAEQTLFDRLSAFAGRFTAADVERVCADGAVAVPSIGNVLATLVDKSMVLADTVRSPTRYRLLETLREFGREGLDRTGDTAHLRGRHASWAVEHAEHAQMGLDEADEAAWSARLNDSFDDLRMAHRWALAHDDTDAALRIVAGTREFAFRNMRYELFDWAESTLSMPDAQAHRLCPVVVATVAYGRFVRGDLDGALRVAERSVDLERQLQLPSCGLHHRTIGNVFYYRGQTRRAAEVCQQMADDARASGDDARLVHALYMASVGLTSAARTDEAHRLALDAVDIAHQIHNPTSLSSASHAFAISVEPSDPHRAAAALEEAVAHGTTAKNRWIVAFARTELLSLASRRGDIQAALRIAREVIDTWYRAGDWANQWLTLRHVASVLAQNGQHEDAATLRASVRVASAELAMPIEPSDLRRVAAIFEHLPDALAADRLADATTKGEAMSAPDVVRSTKHAIDRALGRAHPHSECAVETGEP